MQRRVAERLKTVDKTSLWKSKATSDLVLLSLCVATFFISFFNEIALKVLFIFFAGLLASCLNNISHNFIHQRNNWRMKMAHVVLWSWRDWRVFHGNFFKFNFLTKIKTKLFQVCLIIHIPTRLQTLKRQFLSQQLIICRLKSQKQEFYFHISCCLLYMFLLFMLPLSFGNIIFLLDYQEFDYIFKDCLVGFSLAQDFTWMNF